MAGMKSLPGWLTVPLLVACANAPHWEKSGASETAMADDLQQCRVAARLSPSPHIGGSTPLSSATPLMDRTQERDAQEEQQIRKCMQDKGYSLKR